MAWNYHNSWNSQQSVGGISKYHSSFQKIDRLDECWKRCRSLWRAGNLEDLNYELDAVWMELEADASPEQKNITLELTNKIETVISFQKKQTDPKKINFLGGVLTKLIKKKWTHLFRVEKTQGLGKKYEDGGGDFF